MDKPLELNVNGMTCQSCERRIEQALLSTAGITYAKADFTNAKVTVSGDPLQMNQQLIADSIEALGYSIKQSEKKSAQKWKGLVIALALIAIVIFSVLALQNKSDFDLEILQTGTNISYGIWFVIGLVNSLNCIAMCGGINLSLCASYKPNSAGKYARLLPSILYNFGRMISYTLIGGIVGSIGSVINISANVRGVGAIIAGTFMLLMGLSMLDIRKFRKITPRMPKLFGDSLYKRLGSTAPFSVGLLNGLMPCGPLQSVQFYALGTGGFMAGALSMTAFSLGTIPLMFGIGAAGSLLSQKLTHKMMKVGAILVVLLGLFMLFMGVMNASR